MKKLHNLILSLSVLTIGAASDTALVDPTRPPDAIASNLAIDSSGPLALTAIFSYPGRRIAIINQQMVTIGDKIGDFSVTSITQNTVELRGSANKKLVLTLAPDIKEER